MYLKSVPIMAALAALGACSTLPSSGPTGSQIEDSARESVAIASGLAIEVVPVTSVADLPLALGRAPWSLPAWDPPPSDMIGPGDVLAISIFEAGVSLFGGDGGGRAAGAAGENGFDPSVRVQTLPLSRVDDNGEIVIPYVGRLRVAGMTAGEVQERIRDGLRDLSQNPQVLVNREQVISNSVIVNGEVGQPGRLVLQTNLESVADAIALSGGYRGELKDLVLRLQRGAEEATLRLSDVLSGLYPDLRVYPGDRLTVLADPMMFSVLGASGSVEQMPFTRETMSVVEALAATGGPNPGAGDPEAVFLFRFEGPDRTRPTVYHFNMMQTPSYFLAQQFALRDDDIVYIGNAASNQPRALIQTIGQLFSPIVTAVTISNSVSGP